MSYFEKMIDGAIAKLLDQDLWVNIGEIIVKIIVVLVIASIVIKIGRAAIRNIFRVRSKSPLRISERRENTLQKLLENIVTYVVYFVALITILSLLSIDVKGLLAGAGIVGLAVGFGAQSLVRDIISGFFIIFEDQFSVGDYVGIGKYVGTVEEIGLRITKIKSWTGEMHIVPNGSITEVTNYSIHNSVAVVDINIPYDGNIMKAEKIIEDLLPNMSNKYEEIVNQPELLGVQQLGTSDIMLRVVAETEPMNHWYIARMLRKEIKLALDANGIKAPFPKLVMYSRNEDADLYNHRVHRGE